MSLFVHFCLFPVNTARLSGTDKINLTNKDGHLQQ